VSTGQFAGGSPECFSGFQNFQSMCHSPNTDIRASQAQVGARGYQLAPCFWLFAEKHGALAAKMARESFCLLADAAHPGSGDSVDQLLDLQNRLAPAFEALFPRTRSRSETRLIDVAQTVVIEKRDQIGPLLVDARNGTAIDHKTIADPYRLGLARYLVLNALRLNYADVYRVEDCRL
jgi:hypothetical protein